METLEIINQPDPDPTKITQSPTLDIFRPDPSIIERYEYRHLPGGKKDLNVLFRNFRQRLNTMLTGNTQSGKTFVVEVAAVDIAKRLGFAKPFPVITLSGSSGVTDFDLFGQNAVVTEESEERLVWLTGLVAMAASATEPVFLVIDEPTHMDGRVISSLHSLMDDRRAFINRAHAVSDGNGGYMPDMVKAQPDLWIVSTTNQGYRDNAPLPEAFANRCSFIRWDYDEKVEEKLFKLATTRMIARICRNAREAGHLNHPIGVRALQMFEQAAVGIDPEYAIWNFVSGFPIREVAKVEQLLEEDAVLAQLVEEVKNYSKAADDD
jgi:hypothetical protein